MEVEPGSSTKQDPSQSLEVKPTKIDFLSPNQATTRKFSSDARAAENKKVLKLKYEEHKARREKSLYSELDLTDISDTSIMGKLITDQVRRRMVNSYIRWMVANLLVTIWVGGLVYYMHFRSQIKETCVTQIKVFMLGYLFIMLLHLAKKIVMICFWCYSDDPKEKEAQLNLVFVGLLFLPEIAWYLYGSLIIYSQEMQPCWHGEEIELQILWVTALTLIAQSYIYFLVLVAVMVFFCFAYKPFLDWAKLEERQAPYAMTNKPIEILAEVPVVNNLDVFALHKFKSRQRSNSMDQIIEAPKPILKNPPVQRQETDKNLKLANRFKHKRQGSDILNFIKTPNIPMKNKAHKKSNQCSYCGEALDLGDIVVDCENLHVFHSHCFEEKALNP